MTAEEDRICKLQAKQGDPLPSEMCFERARLKPLCIYTPEKPGRQRKTRPETQDSCCPGRFGPLARPACYKAQKEHAP